MDKKSAGQPEPAGCTEWTKSRVLRMLACTFLCNVNDTRALIGLYLLVTSYVGQIPDNWYSQAFTIVHIVICLSLHIHSFIHLRSYEFRCDYPPNGRPLLFYLFPHLYLYTFMVYMSILYFIPYRAHTYIFSCFVSKHVPILVAYFPSSVLLL